MQSASHLLQFLACGPGHVQYALAPVIKHLASMGQGNGAGAALKKGEEICRAIREMGAGGNLAACTAGVVRRNELDSSEELIERADQALYQAKKNNKGGCSLWRK